MVFEKDVAMIIKTINISEISCVHCIDNIKNELQDMPGVISINGDVAAKNITIKWEEPANLSDIIEILQDIGYPPDPD